MENKNRTKLKGWHKQQEKILKTWGEQAACYRYMHFMAYQKYKKSSMRFTLPIIIISTLTGTANFAQETFPESWKRLAPSVIGGLNLFGGILTTILQFLKINELMESHRVSSILYGKLSRTIRLQLTLPVFERSQESSEFVENCGSEYDRLIEQSPCLPKKIIQNFEREFSDTNKNSKFFSNLTQSNDNKFTSIIKPEIISITPISPYSGEEELKITKEVVHQFRKSRHRPPSPSQRHKVLNELKSLNSKSLVASKINKFSLPEEEPDSPMSVEPQSRKNSNEVIVEPRSRQNSNEVIDDLLEEVVVDVCEEKEEEVKKSVKDLAQSFDKGNSS